MYPRPPAVPRIRRQHRPYCGFHPASRMCDIMRIQSNIFKHAYSFISSEGKPFASLSGVLENSAESTSRIDSSSLSSFLPRAPPPRCHPQAGRPRAVRVRLSGGPGTAGNTAENELGSHHDIPVGGEELHSPGSLELIITVGQQVFCRLTLFSLRKCESVRKNQEIPLQRMAPTAVRVCCH